MRRGQMMSAIGISNSNQSDLIWCVYITTCSFPNHTVQISVIFMHAWVSNIRISYSNIWIQLYIDCDLTYSAIFLHPHCSLLFIIVPLTFSRACMHTHYQSTLSIARMQYFSSGRSPMKAHTHTHPPLHHIGHYLFLTCACATIDVPLCMCVYS